MLSVRQFFPRLLPLFVLAHFAHHLLTALPTPLLPMIRNEFALDYTQSGLVISAFSLSYGIGQLPAGWLADRIGPHILITIGILGVALAGLLVGLSHIFITILVFLALMGVMGGGYHPAAPPMISAVVEEKNRGQALGLHMIGGSASYFLAPIIATAIASTWGWRGSFIGLAIPTIVFGIVLHVLLARREPIKKAQQKKTSSDDDSSATSGRVVRLVLFMILSIVIGALITSTVAFIPLYLVDHFSVREETAGALIGLIYSAGLWVGPLAGYLSDRLGRIPIMLAVCFMCGPVIYLFNIVPYGWGFFALLMAFGVIMYVRFPVSESFIIGQTTARNRSTILGIYYFSAMEGGGVLTPVMGYLIDNLGFFLSFTMAGASLIVVTSVCSIWLWGSRD
jgi:MFS family permease